MGCLFLRDVNDFENGGPFHNCLRKCGAGKGQTPSGTPRYPRPVRLATLAALCLLIGAPVTIAAEGVAQVYARGTIEALAAEFTSSPIAAFSADAAGWPDAVLTCDALQIVRFSTNYTKAGRIEFVTGREVATYTLTDVHATIRDARPVSWIGIYPSQDLTLAMSAPATISLKATDGATIGNAPSTPESEPVPDRPSFGWATPGPVLATNATAPVKLAGTMTLKLSAMLLELEAAENTSSLDTRAPASTTPTQTTRRWAFLECDKGTISTVAPVMLITSTHRLHLESAGRLSMQAAGGSLAFGDAARPIDESPIYLEGRLVSEVSAASSNAETLTLLSVTGDIAATSIALPAGRAAVFSPLTLILLPLTLGAGAIAAYVTLRRKPDTISLEQCIDLARGSADDRKYATAVEWMDRALKFAPGHPHLLCDKAHYLAEMGEVDAALTHFREAIARSDNGEPHILCARLLAQTRGDIEEITALAIAGIEKSPILVLEIEDDPEFESVARRSDFVEAVRRAHRSIE